MNRPFPRLLVASAVLAAVVAAYAGWRNVSARRTWQATRPTRPAPAGAAAPGLDARLAACDRRLAAWPPDRAALVEFTRLCHANGDLAQAETGYRALIALEPNEPRWPHLLASILAGFGQLDDALPLLRRTTQLAPDYLIGWLRLGDALLKADATAEAATSYQEALRRDPENPYALIGLARCDLQTERWSAARSHLQQAVSRHPESAGAQSLLATVFDRLGNPAAAERARERVQNGARYSDPPDPWAEELPAYCHDPYVLLVAASTAVADGTPRKALPLLERALTLAPNDARLHRQLSKTLTALGDPAGARVQIERAAALDPANEVMQLDLVAYLRQTQDQPALERAVASGLATCPGSTGLHFEAGMIAAGAGRLEDAVRHFEFAWRNRPDQTGAPRELAKIYFRSGRDEAGIAVLEKILSHEPRDTATQYLLVQHGIDTGDARTAGWLRRAAEAGGAEFPLAQLQQAFLRRFGADYR